MGFTNLKKLSMPQTLEDYKSLIQNVIPALIYRQESCKSVNGIDRPMLLEANISEKHGRA